MPMYTTIDGVQRELTSFPAMVDGVQRDLESLTATIGGVSREIFSSVKYTWEKYSCVDAFIITGEETTLAGSGVYSVKIYNGTTPNSGTTDSKFSAVQIGNYIIYRDVTYLVTNISKLYSNYQLYVVPVTVGLSMGDYIETVTSKSADAYPDNGEQNGYWYVKTAGGSSIQFTIDGVSYQAEDGMTWAEWCASRYNTLGLVVDTYYIDDGYVFTTDMVKILYCASGGGGVVIGTQAINNGDVCTLDDFM